MRFVLVIGLVAACGPSNRNGDDTADAPPIVCNDGEHQCAGSVYQVCVGGQWSIQEECQVACADQLGCVNCAPNEPVCQDGNVHTCDATGNVGAETEACTGVNICDNGMCVDACANAAEKRSYIGCEYMAADLDNAVEVMDVQGGIGCAGVPGIKNVTMQACGNAANSAVSGACDPGGGCPANFTCKSMNVCVLDAQRSPFGIVVSNPQARSVNVTVTGPNGETITKTIAAGVVEPILPNVAPNTIADQSNDGTSKAKTAYKVTSDLPIVAYQFNPLDNVNVFSNDASLLLPTTAYDVEYYALTWPTLNRRVAAAGNKDNYHGYISVVANQPDTIIEITPKAAVLAGPSQTAIAANTPTQFTLQPHEVLTLQAVADGDLSGTRIAATGSVPFGVFGGHEAMFMADYPAPQQGLSPCCADHIEEMLFPTSTWGKTFAITRSKARGANEPDLLRIMAQKPNTTISFDPSPSAGSCGTLQAGDVCEVQIQGDTGITASEPVLVAHYLVSANWSDPFFGGGVGEGDPSFSIAVPVEQFRTEYTVLVPNAYSKNFLSIATPGAGAVVVDGLVVALTPYAGGLYRAARMQVNAGQHVIKCPNGCGVEVMGYSDDVSYMFAGGLDLKQIVLQ